MSALLDKREDFITRKEELAKQIINPKIICDQKLYAKVSKNYKHIERIVERFDVYKDIVDGLAEAKEILVTEKDEEMREMAKMEIDELSPKIAPLEEKIKLLLVPKDPEDEKNAIIEIRAGAGGDEASIFAGELLRMYIKFCEVNKWKVEITSQSEGTSGGYKEVVAKVTGDGVYGILKYESGVHRVQRVPQTETQGRVHTSASSVVVLPEADEVDVVLLDSDIKKDTYCSSGPGGQSVNTTYSAIRLTHIPTGIVVTCQDEKSQIKNLAKAKVELRTRIYNIEHQKHLDKISAKRKTMVSTGDRSAKIRTYNFPQGRMTDHRIGLTMYNLPAIMGGEIKDIIDKLQIEENTQKLKESEV